MTPRGPNPSGDPEEPFEARGDQGDGAEEASEPGESSLRGWIPPEQRSWRHPSELFGHKPAAGAAPDVPDRTWEERRVAALRTRRRRVATGVAAGSIAAAAAAAALLITASSGTPPASRQAASSVAGPQGEPNATARLAVRSLVGLDAVSGTRTTRSCGVVVSTDGLVATTADALRGATTVRAVTDKGRQLQATVVGTDPGSDVALVRVPGTLPVARFAGNDALTDGGRAAVMDLTVAASGRAIDYRWVATTVASVSSAVRGGGAAGMAGIETTAPPSPVAGDVLLGPDGRIEGILDATGHVPARPPGPLRAEGMGPAGSQPDVAKLAASVLTLTSGDPPAVEQAGSSRAPRLDATGASPREVVFLPTQLVLGVSRDLETSGHVEHGWLDIEGNDLGREGSQTSVPSGAAVPPSGGALVVSVEPFGASAGMLQPGDVITDIDGAPVRSLAELRTRLYVLSPGAPVHLGVWRGGGMVPVAVTLSSSP